MKESNNHNQLLLIRAKTTFRKELITSINPRICPTCLDDEHVRISGKRDNQHQYYCKFCQTYFFARIRDSDQKKIWHDRMKYKRFRIMEEILDHLCRCNGNAEKNISCICNIYLKKYDEKLIKEF